MHIKGFVCALRQEVHKLVYAFWTCKPAIFMVSHIPKIILAFFVSYNYPTAAKLRALGTVHRIFVN